MLSETIVVSVKYTPKLSQLLSDRQLVLSRKEVAEIESVLNKISTHGSPALKSTIQFIQEWIKRDSFLQQFGVHVKDR